MKAQPTLVDILEMKADVDQRTLDLARYDIARAAADRVRRLSVLAALKGRVPDDATEEDFSWLDWGDTNG